MVVIVVTQHVVWTPRQGRTIRIVTDGPPQSLGCSVGYLVAMRLHISVKDEVVAELDRRVGSRERSSFIELAIRRALDEHARTEALEAASGSIQDGGHDWDDDPAAWVRAQRADARRTG